MHNGFASILQGLHLPLKVNKVQMVLHLRSLPSLLEIVNSRDDLLPGIPNLIHGGGRVLAKPRLFSK